MILCVVIDHNIHRWCFGWPYFDAVQSGFAIQDHNTKHNFSLLAIFFSSKYHFPWTTSYSTTISAICTNAGTRYDLPLYFLCFVILFISEYLFCSKDQDNLSSRASRSSANLNASDKKNSVSSNYDDDDFDPRGTSSTSKYSEYCMRGVVVCFILVKDMLGMNIFFKFCFVYPVFCLFSNTEGLFKCKMFL